MTQIRTHGLEHELRAEARSRAAGDAGDREAQAEVELRAAAERSKRAERIRRRAEKEGRS